MADYFEAINNNNSLLIGDTYSNYVLYRKGTVVTGNAGSPIPMAAIVKLPPVTEGFYPIICLVHSGYVNLLANVKGSDGSFEVTFMLSNVDTVAGTVLEWYAFLPSDSPEAKLGQTGLFCLWDETGKAVFDSDANYMRVVDVVSAKYPNEVNRSYPAGRKYAVVVAVNQLYVQSAPSPGGWGNVSGMSARLYNDNLLNCRYQPLRKLASGSPSINTTRNDTGIFMILDVTGY